jgi:hypothetical protein
MTKRRMDKIISLYEKERIDPSAFHGVNGNKLYNSNIVNIFNTIHYIYKDMVMVIWDEKNLMLLLLNLWELKKH